MAAWRSFSAVYIAQFACQHLVLRYGWADLLRSLHGISTLCVVDAHLFWFLKKSKMAAWRSFLAFLLHNKFVCQRLDRRDGLTDFLAILHDIGTWCVVDVRLFWFFFKIQDGRLAVIFGHFYCTICMSAPGSRIWLDRFTWNFAWYEHLVCSWCLSIFIFF